MLLLPPDTPLEFKNRRQAVAIGASTVAGRACSRRLWVTTPTKIDRPSTVVMAP